MKLGDVSFWYADIGLPETRRPALQGDTTADVAIIGAGYTGLWTAWYLMQAAPHLKVLVLEKEFAGFGASGRNGGWCMGTLSWNHERYAATHGKPAVIEMARHLRGTVDEIIRVCNAEGIDADIVRTEMLMFAHNPAQLARLKAELKHQAEWGAADRVRELTPAQVAQRITIPGVLGGMAMSGVARIQPAKLVRGLAAAVERTGAVIHEDTAVLSYDKGRVVTAKGTVTAPIILRCTEGFTAGLPGHERDWLPLNSAQIATPVLPPEVWAKIGWDNFELVEDLANSYCYCQRTREGRITVGARGVPYKFGSGMDKNGEPDAETIARLTEILHRHFPEAAPYGIDHAWCGVIGVPRDWCATVGLDRSTGLGWAGGYVGVGVSTSNLTGRTLADLALGKETEITRLPWVNRKPRLWEREPFRWLGVHTMYTLFRLADRREQSLGIPPSRFAALGNWLTGRH
jgi:glycine/D-amino acid oxidase-like deaminating enzyme